MKSRELEVRYRQVVELVPYARNARTHSDEQVAQIAASIREWGFTNPVLIDEEGGIIAGHGRVLAARKLGMDTVPTILLADLTEAQKAAYVIADNKLSMNAGWDVEMLSAELERLTELSYDVSLIGFSQPELSHFLEGWCPSAGPDDTDPSDDPLVVLIKVRCQAKDEKAVRALVSEALSGAALAGAELVS